MPHTLQATPAQKEAKELYSLMYECAAMDNDKVRRKNTAKKAAIVAINLAIKTQKDMAMVYDFGWDNTGHLNNVKSELLNL